MDEILTNNLTPHLWPEAGCNPFHSLFYYYSPFFSTRLSFSQKNFVKSVGGWNHHYWILCVSVFLKSHLCWNTKMFYPGHWPFILALQSLQRGSGQLHPGHWRFIMALQSLHQESGQLGWWFRALLAKVCLIFWCSSICLPGWDCIWKCNCQMSFFLLVGAEHSFCGFQRTSVQWKKQKLQKVPVLHGLGSSNTTWLVRELQFFGSSHLTSVLTGFPRLRSFVLSFKQQEQ